nr:hypothetical protein [Pseudomonas gessardii]
MTGSRSASRSFDLPYSVDSISREQISDGGRSWYAGAGAQYSF